MAERRMFAKTIVMSDSFLDLSMGARCLYFAFGMVADDDGFVNNPKSIMRQVGASQDDLGLLIQRRFILPFESGVIAIKHWGVNNYIQKDRYKSTKYTDEKAALTIDERGVYTECIQDVYKVDTQVSVGKFSLGKDSINTSRAGAHTHTCEETEENVLKLTDEQIGELKDKLGDATYTLYASKLTNFILKNNAKVSNHYETILKWHREDAARAEAKGQPKGYSSFNTDEFVAAALARAFANE